MWNQYPVDCQVCPAFCVFVLARLRNNLPYNVFLVSITPMSGYFCFFILLFWFRRAAVLADQSAKSPTGEKPQAGREASGRTAYLRVCGEASYALPCLSAGRRLSRSVEFEDPSAQNTPAGLDSASRKCTACLLAARSRSRPLLSFAGSTAFPSLPRLHGRFSLSLLFTGFPRCWSARVCVRCSLA